MINSEFQSSIVCNSQWLFMVHGVHVCLRVCVVVVDIRNHVMFLFHKLLQDHYGTNFAAQEGCIRSASICVIMHSWLYGYGTTCSLIPTLLHNAMLACPWSGHIIVSFSDQDL